MKFGKNDSKCRIRFLLKSVYYITQDETRDKSSVNNRIIIELWFNWLLL